MLNFFRIFFGMTVAAALCSCADMGSSSSFTNNFTNGFQSSFSFNGMTSPAMNPRDIHFYMDDDRMAAPVLSNPAYSYLYDSYCNGGCR